MKMIWIFSIACLLAFAYSDDVCGQSTYGRKIKDFRKLLRQTNEPEVLQKYFESMLDRIPAHNRRSENLRIFFSLQLADLYFRTGNFSESEKLYLTMIGQVEDINAGWLESKLPFAAGTIYDVYDQYGYFCLATGNVRKAQQLFIRSQDRRALSFNKKSVFRIPPLVGLGSVYYRKGDYDSASIFFARAAKGMNRAMTTHFDYDNISRLFVGDLIEIFLIQKKLDAAWDFINRLSIFSSGIGKFNSKIANKMETARILEFKSRYFLFKGDFHRSQEYLNRAYDFYPLADRSSDLKFRLLKTQALIYLRQDKLDDATESFLALSTAYREHIAANFIAMSEYEKEQFYNLLKADFNLFNAYAIAHDDGAGSRLLEEVYNNTLNTKALILNASNKLKNSILQNGNTELIGKFHQWEAGKARLSSLYYDETATAHRIDSLENRIESLENEINLASPLFAPMNDPPVWRDVQMSLKPDEAAIEIIRINALPSKARGHIDGGTVGDSIVYAALILKNSVKAPVPVLLSNGIDLEERFLHYYRNCILGRIKDTVSYKQFWEPVKQELQGISRVYLSVDGIFSQINLNALTNPITGEYLIDEIDLVYVTNTGDVLKEKHESSDAGVALLFGRPQYNIRAPLGRVANSDFVYGMRNLFTDELLGFRQQDFADLPGTEIEIRKIEETLKQRNIPVKAFTGDQALEGRVKAAKNPRILHIATHGFFVDDLASPINPMIRSGLVMAGVQSDESSDTEDGILTAYEATHLNLDETSLVTLSACETGLGEVRNGQGVYGLQRAIMVAGAENLLMSLWKVDDEASATLMVAFYRAWEKTSTQDAFRTAQRELRKKYPQPFFWAAFIMLGK